MSVPLFPLFGYSLAKAEAAQICQRVAERLRPSSWGVLGRNECTIEDHDQGHLYTNLEVPRLTCPGRIEPGPPAWEASTLEKSHLDRAL
jgi:hypothetical protein